MPATRRLTSRSMTDRLSSRFGGALRAKLGVTVVRVVGALVLLVVAASSPVMASAAAEHDSGRKFCGLLEAQRGESSRMPVSTSRACGNACVGDRL